MAIAAQRAYWLAVAAATVITVVGQFVGTIIPSAVARAFTTDADLIAASDYALRTCLVWFWAVGFQIISTAFFQSIGKAGNSINSTYSNPRRLPHRNQNRNGRIKKV